MYKVNKPLFIALVGRFGKVFYNFFIALFWFYNVYRNRLFEIMGNVGIVYNGNV